MVQIPRAHSAQVAPECPLSIMIPAAAQKGKLEVRTEALLFDPQQPVFRGSMWLRLDCSESHVCRAWTGGTATEGRPSVSDESSDRG